MKANDKMVELSKQIVTQGGVIACSLLACDACFLYDEEQGMDIPPSILPLREKLGALFLELYDGLDSGGARVEEYLSKLADFRNEVLAQHFQILGTTFLCNIVRTKIADALFTKQDEPNKEEQPDLQPILGAIIDYVGGGNTEIETRKRISDIIANIPLKMTKQKYSEYIEKALAEYEGMPIPTVARNITCYQEIFKVFDPSHTEHPFEALHSDLRDMFELDTTKMSEDELLGCEDKMDEAFLNVQAAEQFVSCIFDCIHYLFNIAYIAIDKDTILEQDYLVRDLFFALKDFFMADDKSVLLDTIETRAEERVLHYEGILSEMIQRSEKLAEKMDLQAMEEDQFYWVMVAERVKVNSLIRIESWRLVADIGQFKPEESDISVNQKAVRSFITWMNDEMDKLPKDTAKIVKQNFLDGLSYPFALDESFVDYMRYLLEGISVLEKKRVASWRILQLCGAMGGEFDEDFDEDGEFAFYNEGHTHDHDHDCGCGHHH